MAAPTETKALPEPKKPAAQPRLISQIELVKLTGYSLGEVQQAAKEGFIISDRKRYQIGEALLGLCKFMKSRVGKLPVYDNVAQCSAATGIPVSVIKGARRRSKEAFRNNHVHLAPLLRQILGTKKDVDWRGMQEEYAARTAEVEFKRANNEMLDKAEISSAIRRGVSGFWFAFDRAAEIELPPTLKGCDEQGVRVGLLEAGKKLKAALTDELGRYIRNGETK